MKISALTSLFLSIVLFANVTIGFAMETDQYNLPPTPLFDIGDEVSAYVEENLSQAVNKVNADIAAHQACLDNTATKVSKCGSAESELKKLAYLRSNDAVAYEVFKLLGEGSIFVTKTGKWLNKHQFSHEPARFTTDYFKSIYVTLPTDYFTISPTVNLFGVEFGTDKIDHIFQQGYGYYKIYRKALTSGQSADQAALKAVKWGQKTERTYFGLLVSGVYSNADLVANYAGMKFYLGLTQPIQIGNTARPATLALKDGKWAINSENNLRDTLIKPFLTDHLNEALNPSVYAFNLFPSVRRIVRKQSCPQWRKMYPDLSKADLNARSSAMTLWNGEDYGFTKKDKMVLIAETCFN